MQEAVIKTILKKKKSKKAKRLSEKDLQIAEKRKEAKGEKERYTYLFKKISDTKGTFHAKMSTIKDRNGMDLTEAEDIKKSW